MANNFFGLDISEKFTKIADISKVNEEYDVTTFGKTDTNELFFFYRQRKKY